jgi:hypothetical protein
MVSVRVTVRVPDVRAIRSDIQRIERENRRAAIDATDIASKKAQRHIQAKMMSVGLGRLSNAVGQTSAKRKRQTGPDRDPYGVIFARGGDESRAGGALEAYSQGAVIRPRSGAWLAVPTKAAPRFVNVAGRRRRLTPALWEAGGFNQRIGKLIFRQIRSDLALLIVRQVSLSPKTGQAKALGPRRPRTRVVPKGDTVVFVLIKQTRRAKRFDKDEIVRFYADRIPDYMRRLIAGYNRGGE